MNWGIRLARYIVFLALVASSAVAQPEAANQDITEVFSELADTYAARALADIGNAGYEGMEFVDTEYSTLPAVRALAVLSVEQAYIERVLEASSVAVYTLPVYEPIDPFQEVSPAINDTSAFRLHARILDYDSMRCWMDGDFDGGLERVAGIVRLADMLIDTRDYLAVANAGALLDMAKSRLVAMADAAEVATEPPTFSPEAIALVQAQVQSRSAADPNGMASLTANGMGRNARWVRETFAVEGGSERYKTYLHHYGQTEQTLLDQQALVMGVAQDPRFWSALAVKDSDRKDRALMEIWRDLTPVQRVVAYAKARELMQGSMLWWPTDVTLRLLPDDPMQEPSAEQITELLRGVDALIEGIDDAQTREQIQDALTAIRIETELDNSQVTHLCAHLSGTAGLMLWTKSIERYDETMAALQRLEAFVSNER